MPDIIQPDPAEQERAIIEPTTSASPDKSPLIDDDPETQPLTEYTESLPGVKVVEVDEPAVTPEEVDEPEPVVAPDAPSDVFGGTIPSIVNGILDRTVFFGEPTVGAGALNFGLLTETTFVDKEEAAGTGGSKPNITNITDPDYHLPDGVVVKFDEIIAKGWDTAFQLAKKRAERRDRGEDPSLINKLDTDNGINDFFYGDKFKKNISPLIPQKTDSDPEVIFKERDPEVRLLLPQTPLKSNEHHVPKVFSHLEVPLGGRNVLGQQWVSGLDVNHAPTDPEIISSDYKTGLKVVYNPNTGKLEFVQTPITIEYPAKNAEPIVAPTDTDETDTADETAVTLVYGTRAHGMDYYRSLLGRPLDAWLGVNEIKISPNQTSPVIETTTTDSDTETAEELKNSD